MRLVDIKPDDPPEKLIEVIQNKTLHREERQAALSDLAIRFDPLIKKIILTLYHDSKLDLGQYGVEIVDLNQETLVEFCRLVMYDFRFDYKKEGFKNQVYFGPYIRSKLFLRMLRWVQNKIESTKSDWRYERSVDFLDIDNPQVKRDNPRSLFRESLRRAIVNNVVRYDDKVLDHISADEQREMINEFISISNTHLDPRQCKVWYLKFFSEKRDEEIGPAIAEPGQRPIGRVRVAQIADEANKLILAEWARRVAMRKANIY